MASFSLKYLLPAFVMIAWVSTASVGSAQIIRELKKELKEKVIEDLRDGAVEFAADKAFCNEEINQFVEFMGDCKGANLLQCLYYAGITSTQLGPIIKDDDLLASRRRKEEAFKAACKQFVPIALVKLKDEYRHLEASAEKLEKQDQLLKDQEAQLIQRQASMQRAIADLRQKESLLMAASASFSQEANRLVIEREKMDNQTRQLQTENASKLENTVFWKEHYSHWKNHFKQASESLPNEAHRKAAMDYWKHYEATFLLPEAPPPYFTGDPKNWKTYVESNRTAAKEYREIMEAGTQESKKIAAAYHHANNDYQERLSKCNSQKEALTKELKVQNDNLGAVNKQIDTLKQSFNTLARDKMSWLKRLAAMRTVSRDTRWIIARCKEKSVTEAQKWEDELWKIALERRTPEQTEAARLVLQEARNKALRRQAEHSRRQAGSNTPRNPFAPPASAGDKTDGDMGPSSPFQSRETRSPFTPAPRSPSQGTPGDVRNPFRP